MFAWRRRCRRRGRQVVPASYSASHVDHEKRSSYKYGASLLRPFRPAKLRYKSKDILQDKRYSN